MNRFLSLAVSDSSERSYATAWNHWKRYAAYVGAGRFRQPVIKAGCPQRVTDEILAGFVGFLESTGTGNTCTGRMATRMDYVNGVVKSHLKLGVVISSDSEQFTRARRGMVQYAEETEIPAETESRQRFPITPTLMHDAIGASDGDRDHSWFKAAAAFAFGGFLRKMEFLMRATSSAGYDPEHDPSVGDCVFTMPDGTEVRGQDASWEMSGGNKTRGGTWRFSGGKTNPASLVYRCKHTKRPSSCGNRGKYRNVEIAMVDTGSNNHLVAVSYMWEYLCERNDGGHPTTASSPLFVYNHGTDSVSANQFNARMKHFLRAAGHDPTRYSSHSFRHGRASWCIATGQSVELIKRLGRWAMNSTALDHYVHNTINDAAESARRGGITTVAPAYTAGVVRRAGIALVGGRPMRGRQ